MIIDKDWNLSLTVEGVYNAWNSPSWSLNYISVCNNKEVTALHNDHRCVKHKKSPLDITDLLPERVHEILQTSLGLPGSCVRRSAAELELQA